MKVFISMISRGGGSLRSYSPLTCMPPPPLLISPFLSLRCPPIFFFLEGRFAVIVRLLSEVSYRCGRLSSVSCLFICYLSAGISMYLLSLYVCTTNTESPAHLLIYKTSCSKFLCPTSGRCSDDRSDGVRGHLSRRDPHLHTVGERLLLRLGRFIRSPGRLIAQV